MLCECGELGECGVLGEGCSILLCTYMCVYVSVWSWVCVCVGVVMGVCMCGHGCVYVSVWSWVCVCVGVVMGGSFHVKSNNICTSCSKFGSIFPYILVII